MSINSMEIPQRADNEDPFFIATYWIGFVATSAMGAALIWAALVGFESLTQ